MNPATSMSRPTKVIFIILSLVLIISLYYNFSLSGQIRQLKDPQAFAQNQIAKIVLCVGLAHMMKVDHRAFLRSTYCQRSERSVAALTLRPP